MKGVTDIGALRGIGTELSPAPSTPELKGKDFSEILKQKFESIVAAKQFDEVRKFEGMIHQKGELKPKELIMYQIQASQFGLRVELLSRVGESLLNTVRKFQQGQ